jgi:rSAM/selenodomain-associated transferase 2
MRPALAIIIPVLNEADGLADCLQALRELRKRGTRVVVVDGGSEDQSLEIARKHSDLAFRAPRGRGAQMNAGAAACPANVLLFLHADSRLPPHADALVARALNGASWGRFDVRIDSPRAALRLVERTMNLRSRWTGIATGDQALFIGHDLFHALGGFPDIPLMEDIALSRTLLRHGRPACLHEQVVTSARRWERDGVARTVLRMWHLRSAYFMGADPARLALAYGYRPRQR